MILKTEIFEGPFDLLLHLIRKNEINIYDIPISVLTDQYIGYVENMLYEMNSMSEFILMAATLLEIKSKMLIPRPMKEIVGEKEADPREELVRRLIEYKRIKTAADELKTYEIFAENFFYKDPENGFLNELKKARPPIGELLSDLDMQSLLALFNDVMSRKTSKIRIEERFDELLKRAAHSVQEKMTEVTNLLHLRREMALTAILQSCESRSEKIAVFLAVLELVKLNEIILKDSPEREDFLCGMYAR